MFVIFDAWTKEQEQFLADVLAVGVIEATKDCLTPEGLEKQSCKTCEKRNICNTVKRVFDKVDEEG